MGRSLSFALILIILVFIAGLTGCHSNAVGIASFAVPTSISLNPANTASLEVGTYMTFTASASDSSNHAIANEPISYASSNQAVVTVAANGLACAGTWNSLSNPQICTPGQIGTAVITANAQGVTSPSTTVYVHQHIDKILVSPVAAQPPPFSSLCFSARQATAPVQSYNYQANAYSGTADITSTVGPFTWQTAGAAVVTLNVASLSKPVTGLLPGQVQAVPNVPGTTTIYASASGVNSAPFSYTTCPVQSISVAVNGGTGNSILTTTGGGAKVINATVTDILGNQIYGIPLTWCSSSPLAVTVGGTGNCSTNASSSTSQFGGTISASPAAVGDSTITATCTPPSCNVGILPTQPIYPENVVNIVVKAPSGGTGTSEAATFYVSSTDCGIISGCISEIVPISASNNTIGTGSALPATPNSVVFNRQGTSVYMGTDFGDLGSQGLMVLNTASGSVSRFTSIVGKVLAVSPDGTEVIVSDTLSTPNQVYAFNTSNNALSIYTLTGATAADFSPDSLKAFIVAGNNLYVYSKLDALRAIPLPNPATAVSFLPEGAFAYLAGGNISKGLSTYSTVTGLPGTSIPTNAPPTIVRSLPNSSQVLAFDAPNIDIISVPNAAVESSINLGQGIFRASQLILAPDGVTAYIVSPTLNSILVFDIQGLTSTAIPLAGNVTPVEAALSPDGTLIYVAASDATVHVVNTVAGGDIQQITFPENLCLNTADQPYSSVCKPNLLAVKP